MKYLFLCLLLLLLACTSDESKKQVRNSTKNAWLTSNNESIDFIENDTAILLAPISLNSKIDSLRLLLSNCTNHFCRLNDTPITYRSNHNKNYFIEFDPSSTMHKLLDENGKNLGKIMLNANNPEFAIQTMPLEKEAGILLVDGLYGYKKYLLNNSKFTKALEVKFDLQLQYEKFIVLKDQSNLVVLKRDLKNKKAFLEIQSLVDGKVKHIKEIDYQYKNLQYFSEDQILVLQSPQQVLVLDQQLTKEHCLFKKKTKSNDVLVHKNDEVIDVLLRTKTGFSTRSFKDGIIDSTNYTLQKRVKVHQFSRNDHYQIWSYFEMNKDTAYSQTNKIIHQGVFITDLHTRTNYKLELAKDELFQIVRNDANQLILQIGDNYFSLAFDKLNSLRKN